MNKRGQFSIIAALFVAVILIATVIATYSMIRNSPIQTQPQFLSAIDETNFAMKQILGFTVGYYGSILQVTGNSTYAKELATNYLLSGLENAANMHPDWGTSINVKSTDLYTYWFTNKSYSTGTLNVNYNLTGLGIFGIDYRTSCKLDVQITNATNPNQARLIITKDDNEPLINLGKQNFEFYKYDYASSIWQQAHPSNEPTAFANGTYLIDVPSGVDPYSYLLFVEDPRGIIVVASSFKRYTCEFTWTTPSKKTLYAVTGSTAQILGAPDGNYATIAKGGTCEVTDYQGNSGTIKQVYFNLTYYGTVSGTLEWYYRLDSGSWTKIENLPQGGSSGSPLQRTYNASNLRASWTWSNLNTTDIRFFNNDDGSSENAYVDSMYVTLVVENGETYSTVQDSVIVELLQNGTMNWLGQNLRLTTSAKPFPPIPVRAIRLNQTINGINREVPFQIEDWNDNYRVPAGLTNNATVFSNRQMIVFLANHNVSKTTIWWNGQDNATQTPYAYRNLYFTGDNPSGGILTNGILRLQFGSGFVITSTRGTSTCAADFMRINSDTPGYGSNLAYIIHHGVVRDVAHQEAEWSDGIPNCPDVYSQIIITLPANVTYYTYKLRLIFVPTQQTRRITDLCPIRLTLPSGLQSMTENGTSLYYPIVSNSSASYKNYSISTWAHHWSQFISGSKGAGIMFTDADNRKLYVFDSIAGSKTGALKVTSASRTIEFLPVTLAQTSFQYALDVSWNGAVVTFDGTKPIYTLQSGVKTGMWILVEYPPSAKITSTN